MPEDRNSYKSITKAITLFGGVKVVQIVINVVKNKFIAVLLGPAGMGIAGMITSTTSMIEALTGCGLQTSGVRDVSQAYSSGDTDRANKTVSVLRQLVLFTGLLGTVLCFLMSPLLSRWAFGNTDYNVAFKIVSVILFMDQLCIGQTVVLQGTFHYKYMARASLIGSIIGLVTTVPLYYLWGMKAIVPVIILTSFFNLLLTWIYSRKVPFQQVPLSIKDILKEGKIMITLGVVIALTGVINTGQTYILRLFISHFGNIADVGLYTAGISLATSYVGVVLSAMASDYSPRLAAVADDDSKLTQVINRQSILLITILSPLILLFIVFIRELTILLYSNKFIAITGMLEWIMYGMFFRAISWSISYCFIGRGESKIFFWNELGAAVYSLLFSIVGYKIGKFTGMGIAFCLTYFVYSIQVFLLAHQRFNFSFEPILVKKVVLQLSLCTIFFVVVKLLGYNIARYIIGSIGIVLAVLLSYRYLDQMIGIKQVLSKKIKDKECLQ